MASALLPNNDTPSSTTLYTDWAMRLSPVMMAQAVGLLPLDDWQVLLLESRQKRLVINACRQSGKSSCASVLAMHQALYTPESLVLLCSPSLRQSSELMQKCQSVYRALGRPVEAVGESALSLSLANDSRVVSLPGEESTTRGFSKPSLVILDEASRVELGLFMALKPMFAVSPQGRLLLLSTPNGMDKVFYQAWQSQDEGWEKYMVTAPEIPRITPSFLANERASVPDYYYKQEYLCQFQSSSGSLFRQEDVDAAFSQEFEAWTFP